MTGAFEMRIGAGLGLLALACGFALPEWMLFLGAIAATKGLVVLGLLVMWRAGLVSFGHALYFAAGGYGAGLLARAMGASELPLLLIVGGICGGIFALATGFLLARYREIFFAMLSLALSMILYGILVKSEALGSTDGVSMPGLTLLGAEVTDGSERILYLTGCLLSIAAGYAAHLYLRSLWGRAAEPIRDNEVRVEYLGLSVRRLIHVKLVISGVLAGIAGALSAVAVGHIDPEMAYWTTSGGFVFIAILSGAGSVIAPFLGAVIFEAIRTFATGHAPEYWQLILGGALLATIFFLPGGIWSLIHRAARSRDTAPSPAKGGPAHAADA